MLTLIKSDSSLGSRQGGLRGSSWLVRPFMSFDAYYSIADVCPLSSGRWIAIALHRDPA